jgi:hypothetical protein
MQFDVQYSPAAQWKIEVVALSISRRMMRLALAYR